jgi:cation:H+ antiporter
MSALATVLGFATGAVAIVLAGIRLARHGDVIAARTRLGGLWMGSIFVAMATSLPELATDVAAVRLGVPDLAAGDLFGSSMANMLILALVSLVPGTDLFRRAAIDNALAAALAIVLTATAAGVVMLRPRTAILGVGPGSLLLFVGYVAGVRAVFRNSLLARAAAKVEEMGEAGGAEGGAGEGGEGTSLRQAAVGFALAALVILVAAPLFAGCAKRLAELTGMDTSFLGTWLVGLSTSLPELVTSLAAVRIHAYDLAVGNLFGSNALNMAIFLPLDLAHTGGPVLGAIEPVHALSALCGVVLMGIGLAAIIYRARGRITALEPSSALMVAVYVAALVLVYAYGGPR